MLTESIKIKHVDNNEGGYALISAPPTTTKKQFINIISAIQKDETDRVVAQAHYNVDEIDGFDCGGNTISSNDNGTPYTAGRAIYLEDHPQLPIIVCQTTIYNKEIIPNK